MSAGVIVAIVVGALIVIGLVIALIARARSDERALNRRRTQAATARREEADRRGVEAERAERRARLAQAEAEHHRAESRLHHEQAEAYEQGLADDRLREGDGAGAHDGADRAPTADRPTAPDQARR